VPDPENGGSSAQPAWNYGFDKYGRQITMTDAKGRTTTNIFDQYGRAIAQRLPGSQTNWTIYNTLGQVTNQYDFKGQRKEIRYDRLGRVATNYWFAAGASYPSNCTEYYYNVLGQLTNMIERSGTDASSGYVASTSSAHRNRYLAALARVPQEARGGGLGLAAVALAIVFLPRHVRERLMLALSVSLSRRERARGRGISRFSFSTRRLYLPTTFWRLATYVTVLALVFTDPRLDFWSLHAECVYPANSSSDTTRLTFFAYDFDGHLTQANYPEGVINYEYDPATGRHTGTCTTNSYVAYHYDELGRLQTVTVSKRNGQPVIPNEVTTYTYTPVGNRSTVTLPNGIVATYVYDSLNRLTSLTNSLGNNLLASYNYQLHPTGRRTNAVEIVKIPDSEGGGYLTNTLSWAYDQMYRLTNEISISSAPGGTGTYTNAYAYTKVGNRFSRIHYQNGTTTTTNTFNENDQLLNEVSWSGTTMTESNAYTYDDNGSLVSKASTVGGNTTNTLYNYDLKNKLCTAINVQTSATNSFVYNDSGIRVRSTAGCG
jgi:uncharacterized protein RhaS with RHS repeats